MRYPKWNREWEHAGKDLCVLLIPKFDNHVIGRWFMSKMKRPRRRVKLDEIGSFVWQRCDGSHSVKEIGEALSAQFGNKVDPVFDRLHHFLATLERSKTIIWMS